MGGPRLRLHLPHAGESRPFSVRLPGQAYPLPSQKTPVQQSQLLEQLLLGFPTTCCKAPPVAQPAAQWEQRFATPGAGKPGPTVALRRSSGDERSLVDCSVWDAKVRDG